LSLPALSTAYHADSARAPFIPPDPSLGYDDRLDCPLFALQGVGAGWESKIVACDGLESLSENLSSQSEVSSFG
jgi:hypothetical protein